MEYISKDDRKSPSLPSLPFTAKMIQHPRKFVISASRQKQSVYRKTLDHCEHQGCVDRISAEGEHDSSTGRCGVNLAALVPILHSIWASFGGTVKGTSPTGESHRLAIELNMNLREIVRVFAVGSEVNCKD